MKILADEMMSWWNDELMKWLVDKLIGWQNNHHINNLSSFYTSDHSLHHCLHHQQLIEMTGSVMQSVVKLSFVLLTVVAPLCEYQSCLFWPSKLRGL
jgi:hypothetical protein